MYTTYTLLTIVNVAAGSRMIHAENVDRCAVLVARYVLYLILIQGSREVLTIGFKWLQKKKGPKWSHLVYRCKPYLTLMVSALAVVLYMRETVLAEEIVFLFISHLIIRSIELKQNVSTINYGVGMACSFIEGYLVQILPSDGANFVGFEENIRIFESSQRVVFPVKKMFLVITKSLYCPPDLKHFNKTDPSLPYIEACRSLDDVQKDVAGVKGRVYRNSAYKIHRPGAPITYLAAECATPLHTLHRVLQKRAVYQELSSIDPTQIAEDFCTTLKSVIARMPDCKGKCELVYFDDTDPSQNLADVLLEAIRRIEPNFENISRS